jgi:hypothetical protein
VPRPAAARETEAARPARASQRSHQPAQLGVVVGIAGGLSTGLVPHLAPTFAASAGLELGDWSAALRLGFTPEQHARLANPAAVGGKVSLASAALEAGFRPRALSLEFPMLAGVESGFFTARGEGLADAQTRILAWLAGYLSLGVAHTWSQRWRLGLRLDGLLALRRPRFAIDLGTAEPALFYRPKLVGVRVYLGLDLILW